MRDFTQQELQNDFRSLQLELITRNGADKLSQAFHFDEFFAYQIEAWGQLDLTTKKEYMERFHPNTTFAEFFTHVAKDFRTQKYTTFNIEMLYQLIKTINPTTLIDPCMGWGQRMILSTALGLDYYGTDVNATTVENNQKLYSYISTLDANIPFAGLTLQDGVNAPNFATDPCNTLLFTCPPYYDREVYSDAGIENGTYSEYIEWWKTIAQASFDKGIKSFAFQITPKYGDDLKRVTEEVGYKPSFEINNTRKEKDEMHINVKGEKSKRNYGKIYVFSHTQTCE